MIFKKLMANRSEKADAAIAAAKELAGKYGLRKILDDGTPRCVFLAHGDECVCVVINVKPYMSAFDAAGFERYANIPHSFSFAPSRMAEVAAIVNGQGEVR